MFELIILTLEETLIDGSVYSLVVPGAEGYFQVLTNQAPLISLVQAGKVEIEKNQGYKEVYAISGGFFEISHNKATLIADAFEKASKIDYERAALSLKKAKDRLETGGDEVDVERAKLAIKRAENRIRIYLQTLES